MTTDKLQAVHEAFADVFNGSHLHTTRTETSQPAFDHDALSEAFSGPHQSSATTEQSSPVFDRAALAGVFNKPFPISTNTKPSPASFDHHAFAEMLSESSPISANTKPSQPSFDHQVLAEILNEAHSSSTDTKPFPSDFDQQALAEILGEPVPTSSSTRPSPAGLDHEALPETLSELRPVAISPQLSPRGLDAGYSSATRQLDDDDPVAKPIAVAPSTNAESAPPQRSKSLLTKLHHILSTKAGSPPPGGEKDPSPTPVSRRIHTPEPPAVAVPAAFPTDAETAPAQLLEALLTEVSPLVSTLEMRPSNFEQEPSSSRLSVQPGYVRPAVRDVAAASATETASAQPLRATSQVAKTSSLISAKTEASPPVLEKNTPTATFASDLDNVDPEVRAVAVSAPAECEGAKSLLTELPSTSASTKPPPIAGQKSSRLTPSGQPSNAEPAAALITVATPTNAESAVTQPWKAPLRAEVPSDSRKPQPPSQVIESAPSPVPASGQPDQPEPAANILADDPPAESAVTRAQQAQSLLAQRDLSTAIRLRWVMRDIRSKRTKLSPVSDNDLKTLMDLGLVEMREELPRLTALGVLALD